MLLPQDTDPLLTQFSSYWLAARGRATVPQYRDIDPIEMPWALPSIFVLETVNDEPFRYRLVGENMQNRLAPAMRGKTAFDIFEQSYAEWTEQRWRRAATELLASYVHTQHETTIGRHVNSERILFPALDENGVARFLIGVSVFSNFALETGIGAEKPEAREVRWTALKDLPHVSTFSRPVGL